MAEVQCGRKLQFPSLIPFFIYHSSRKKKKNKTHAFVATLCIHHRYIRLVIVCTICFGIWPIIVVIIRNVQLLFSSFFLYPFLLQISFYILRFILSYCYFLFCGSDIYYMSGYYNIRLIKIPHVKNPFLYSV